MNISVTVWFDKNKELEKKIGILTFQKVAKTVNIGEKSPVADCIDYLLTVLFL